MKEPGAAWFATTHWSVALTERQPEAPGGDAALELSRSGSVEDGSASIDTVESCRKGEVGAGALSVHDFTTRRAVRGNPQAAGVMMVRGTLRPRGGKQTSPPGP